MAHAYLDESLEPLRAGDLVELSGDEAHHAVKVARLRVGESVLIGNGRGLQVACVVEEVAPSRFTARALEDATIAPAPTPRIHLAQGLAKGGRDELAVQAAVELGVAGVIPWQARRSVSQWRGDKQEKQRARWQTICREAAKQALRPWVPQVAPLRTTAELVDAVPGAQLLVLDPRAPMRLSEVEVTGDDLVLVVGPEGGIDESEFDELVAAGATRVRLGDEVLRTSTAGPAALAALAIRLGRW